MKIKNIGKWTVCALVALPLLACSSPPCAVVEAAELSPNTGDPALIAAALSVLSLGGFAVHISKEAVDVLIHLANRSFRVEEHFSRFVTKLQAVLFMATITERV